MKIKRKSLFSPRSPFFPWLTGVSGFLKSLIRVIGVIRVPKMLYSFHSFFIRVIRDPLSSLLIRDIRVRVPRLLMRKRGYTIVEMMVVLAIIALMMAIVVPRFAMSQKGVALKGASQEVMSALRTARRLAILGIRDISHATQMYAVAFDIYSVPARFAIVRKTGADFSAWQIAYDFEELPENIAIAAISKPTDNAFNVTRTDDGNLNGVEDTLSSDLIWNPQVPSVGNGITNIVYRLVKFWPTGTADHVIIYLWNVKDGRQEIPNPTVGMTLSNLHTLGVPPGLQLDDLNDQQSFFRLPSEVSTFDSYYYTIVVSSITGGVTVYDYAWGEGGGTMPNMRWDRKKDGS
jgi:prepilin-type N-terminal cleavage/methylation domain-containing protein